MIDQNQATDASHHSFLDRLQPIKYRLLLGSLLLLSILSPFPNDSSVAKVVNVVLLQIVLLTCVLAVRQYRRLFWIAAALGLIAFCDISLEYADQDAELHTSSFIWTSLFFVVLGTTFMVDILRAPNISFDQISGALCVYLIIGTVWSFLFAIVLKYDPAAIKFPHTSQSETHLSGTLTYFSFVTLTTLGYGDIHPVSQSARTLCWVEAVIGQIFMTVLVARLVGLNLAVLRHQEID